MTPEERFARYLDKTPDIHPDAYVSPQSTIIGDVTLKALSSIWPGAVLRGDINSIVIGEGSNVQDGSIVHLADDFGVEVGDYVTIGHLAMIHACSIAEQSLIGMNSTVLDGAEIGPRCVIGANALVTKGFKAPEGSVIMGVPGKVVKTLNVEEQNKLKAWADKYVQVSAAFKQRGL